MKKRLWILFGLFIFFLIGIILYNNLTSVHSEVIVVSDTVTNLCNYDICRLPQLAHAAAIGMNLGEVVYYSPQLIFVDVFKSSSPWISSSISNFDQWSSGISVPMDTNGYPLQIPYDPDGPGGTDLQKVKTLMLRAINGHYPAGTYTLIFEGKGTINLGLDARQTFTNGGTYTFSVTPSESGILLEIVASDVQDRVRNIRVIMPGHAGTYSSQPFYPSFIQRLSGFKALRFMDAMQANYLATPLHLCDNGLAPGSPNCVFTWDKRTTPSYATQGGEHGLALEYMIDIANAVGADPWFTLPHAADDNYFRQFARLVRERLDPQRKVYLELSNEVWGFGLFLQADHFADKGVALGLDKDRLNAARKYFVKRLLEMHAIFQEEFVGQEDRLVKILPVWAGNIWWSDLLLSHTRDSSINPKNIKVDALAIAPYFGVQAVDIDSRISTISVDEILNLAEQAISPSRPGKYTTENFTKDYKALADQYGVKLLAYEGGQHLLGFGASANNQILTDKLIAANRHPRIKELYKKYLNVWYGNGGGLLMHFNYVYTPQKWGYWGALEWQDQPINQAPKYEALVEYSGGSTPPPLLPLPLPLPPIIPTILDSTRAAGSVRVDGLSLEWAGIPSIDLPASRYILALGIPSGDADVSASVRSQWDDQNLYFLVQVLDEALFSDSQLANLWEDDGVELYLDGLSERASSYDANDFQLNVRIDNSLGGVRSGQALGVVHSVARQSGGYSVEYAVPFSLLGIQPAVGRVVGYDIGVNDDDNGGARDAQIMLYGDGTGWRNPSVFGRLQLVTSSTKGGGISDKEKPIIEIKSPLEGIIYKNIPVQLQFSVFKADNCSYELDGVKGKEGCNIKEILNFASSKQGISEQHILKISATNANGVSELVVKFNYLQTRKAIIKYYKFRNIGKTFNLDDLKDKDLEDIPLVLDNQNGRIEIPKVNLFKNLDAGNIIDLDFNVDISYAKISLNKEKLTELNKPANLIFYNITFESPKILRDGVECSNCKIISHDKDKKELIIEVQGFSVYEIVEGKVEEPPQQTGGNGGGSSGGSGGGSISDSKTSPSPGKKINSKISLKSTPLKEVSPLLRKIVLSTDVNYVEIEENEEALLQVEEEYYKVLFELSDNVLKLKVDDREYNISSDEIARLNIGESEAYLSFKKLENKPGVVAFSLDYDKIAEEAGLKKKIDFILIYLFAALLFLVIFIVLLAYKLRKRR